MRYAVLFPGQGSQFVGMGEDLFAARPDLLGAPADEVLGWSLRDLCLAGSEEELTRTDRAQPALYALGYALWEEARVALPGDPVAAAGHSLGEYTALAAAGVFDYLTGLALVAARGAAMAEAAAIEPSGMAALLGVDAEQAEAIAAKRRGEGGRLWVANLNSPAEVVVAGGAADIDWVAEHGKSLGARRAIPLKVAGAFHSPFMQSAAAELSEALGGVGYRSAAFDVWANATAAPYDADVGASLTAQLTSPVRFSESLAAMAAAGAEAFVHVGPGTVTAGLAKRSAPEATAHIINSIESVVPAATALGASLQ